MNLKQLLLRSLFWQSLQVLSAFALNIVMAKKFGAATNGVINYLQFIFAGVILVAGISLESSLTYYGASQKIRKHSLAWFALIYTVAISVILVGAAELLAYLNHWNELPEHILWLLVYVTGYLFINNFTALFYTGKNVIAPNLVKVLINLLLIVILFIAKDELIASFFRYYMLSFLVCGLLIMIAYFLFIDREQRSNFFLPLPSERKRLLKYAVIACFTNFIFFLVYRIDYWFVEKYCNLTALGNYTQASKIVQYFQMVPVFLAATLFPATAAGMIKKEANELKYISRLLFSGYFVLLMILIFTGNWLFPFLFGDTYNIMFLPFLLLIPGILALSNMAIVCAYFAGRGMIKVNLTGNIIALVIIIIGDAWFVPRFGIKAAALVSSIGYIANMIYVLYKFNKQTKSNWREMFIATGADIKQLNIR